MTDYERMDVAVAGEDETTTTNPVSVKQLNVHHVTIHPLVLLSAADHYHRVARGTRKRVVGALLGQVRGGRVDATNSFAVPFEEDSRNPAVFYLDHNYLESMLAMFRKVNAKERVVGFYSTGPQIRSNDLRIYDIVERFAGNKHTATNKQQPMSTYPPVFCIIDIRPDRPALPVTAYKVIEQVVVSGAGGTSPTLSRTFAHVSVEMGAMEAEEVGVEHLLRDVHDPTVSTTAALVQNKLRGLETLHEKLCECRDYLLACSQAQQPANPEILANLQTILSLLPNLNNEHLVKSIIIKMNDYYMAIYLAALIRSIMALHDLINNKIRYGPDGTEYREEEAMKQQAAEAKNAADEEKKEDEEEEKRGDNNNSKKDDKKMQNK